jgi:hypothetical protein
MSALGVAQVAVVLGPCTAGGAYIPAMCDETVVVKGKGTVYLGGPPLVKAATGEDVTTEELGGGEMHTRVSGVLDRLAESEEDAFEAARAVFEAVPRPPARAPRPWTRVDGRDRRSAARLLERAERAGRAVLYLEGGEPPLPDAARRLALLAVPWIALRVSDVAGFSVRALSPRFLFARADGGVAGLSALEATARLHDDGLVDEEDVPGLLERLSGLIR